MGKTHNYEGYIGYVRIDGPDIKHGVIDVQSVKHTIDGTDKVLRYFLAKQDSTLASQGELHYPVVVREGCWEVLIPYSALVLVAVRPLGTYINEAAKVLANNDMKDKTTKDVFVGAFGAAQNVIKIAKHIGTMKNRQELNAKVTNANHIVITNSQGQDLIVTKRQLDEYQSVPKDLFAEISYPAVNDRSVHIGYVDAGEPVDQSIGANDRGVFYNDAETKEELFPELKHGDTVDIEGKVTRGNERSNTVGFEYQGHILTCSPINNYVTNFLQAHYKKCVMHGIVSRHDETGEDTGRPRIHFTDLSVLEDEGDKPQQKLL